VLLKQTWFEILKSVNVNWERCAGLFRTTDIYVYADIVLFCYVQNFLSHYLPCNGVFERARSASLKLTISAHAERALIQIQTSASLSVNKYF